MFMGFFLNRVKHLLMTTGKEIGHSWLYHAYAIAAQPPFLRLVTVLLSYLKHMLKM